MAEQLKRGQHCPIEILDAFKADIRAGSSVKAAAEKHGLGLCSAYNVAHQLKPRRGRPPLTQEEKRQHVEEFMQRHGERLALLESGLSYAEIGRRLGVTRERIRQIALTASIRKTKAERRRQNKNLVQPFLAYLEPRCLLCYRPRAVKATFCPECKALIGTLKSVKSRLLAYTETGRTHHLSQITSDIKQFGLVPEDLLFI